MANQTDAIIAKLHNSVISYADLKKTIPSRENFLDQTLKSKLDSDIQNNEELMFLPTYLMETHMQDEKYQKTKYKIVLMGILRDGRRMNVLIDGIEPYFEILIPEGDKESQKKSIDKALSILENDDNTIPTRKSTSMGRVFKYYQTVKSRFLRVYYLKTKNRQEAIKLIRKNGYQTTHDDLASYYRVVCRDFMTSFSSWVKLNDYSYETVPMLKGETIRIDIKNYKAFTGELTGDLLKDKTLSCCWDIETWSKDKDVPMPDRADNCIFCLSMTFQWVNDKDPFLKIAFCDLPADAKEGYLSVICGSETNIIKAFAETFSIIRPEFIFGFNDSDYDWNWVIKRAAKTKGLLIKLAECFDSTVPYMQQTDEGVLKYSFKKEHVKVEANSYVDGFSLMMHGYIPVDVRTIFRRLYPTAEQSSLKWFLAENKLGGKEDMPYDVMFNIYTKFQEFVKSNGWKRAGTECGKLLDLPDSVLENLSDEDLDLYEDLKKQLADINYYCVVDAQRCHDLVKIRSVIMDHREVSNLAYSSVYDAFYRANGMKVRNLTIAVGQREPFTIRFTNIASEGKEEGKYPGAFVLPPRKGLKVSKLSIEERINKSNISKTACQEWKGTSEKEIKQFYEIIEEYGSCLEETAIKELETKYKLPKKFKDFLKESIGRPITGLDFASLYPSLIRTYNFSPEYCILNKKQAQVIHESGQKITKVDFNFNGRRRVGYFVWHNNEYEPWMLDADKKPILELDAKGEVVKDDLGFDKKVKNPKFQFGVYPYILNDLFNKRVLLKKKMKVFEHRKETIEAMTEEKQKELAEEYADVVFNINYLNSKQNALKVFMNTFYGECGNKLSPFFVLEVAGGITEYGQKSLQLAYAFVKEKKCNVYYGDSVIGSTKLLLKNGELDSEIDIKVDSELDSELDNKVDNEIDVSYRTTIEELSNDYEFYQYNNGKEIAFPDGNIDVWSDLGWTKIKHIIRHKTYKKLYQIATPAGIVICTEDHSLLDENGTPIKPCDLKRRETRLLYKVHQNAMPISQRALNKHGNVVYSVEEIPNKKGCYVYDLETENHHFAAGDGCLILHNTDSLYLSIPESEFTTLDKQYYTGKITKLDYWTKLVEQTFIDIKPVMTGINEMFIKDNDTKFLSMSYEEVLYPVAFTAKKKYFGIKHENIPNFKPKKLFIKGLEVKKRGVSDLLKKTFMEIMWTCCSVENINDLMELVLSKIDEIYAREWSSNDFIQTGVYRPTKNNVKIKKFVERMKERGIEVKPNERFNYVVVKKYPYVYDIRGRKKDISIGDKLEFADVIESKKHEIDLDYYMQGSVNGQLARLITYHDMFYVDPIDDTQDELKVAEDKIYKNACKFIETHCEKYYATYNTFGKTHQKIFKTVSKVIGGVVKETDALTGELLSANVDYDDFETWIINYTSKQADKQIGEYGKEYIDKELDLITKLVRDKYKKSKNGTEKTDNEKSEDSTPEENPSPTEIRQEITTRRNEKLQLLQKAYYGAGNKSIIVVREKNYKQTMSILQKRIRENFDEFMKLYKVYNKGVESMIDMMRDKLSIDDQLFQPTKEKTDFKIEDFEYDPDVDDEFTSELEEKAVSYTEEMMQDTKLLDIMNNLKMLYNNLITAHTVIKRARSTVDYLKLRRNNTVRSITRPNEDAIDNMIRESVINDRDSILSLNL